MSSKRTYQVLGLMFLALTLVLLPGPAKSAMWVGGEVGGNFISNSDIHFGDAKLKDVKFEPAVIGGITVGYDFVNSGCAGYNWPAWMQYFSFAVDFTYNSVEVRDQQVSVSTPYGSGKARFGYTTDGYMAATTFLFMGHYGFFPDSEVPSGRVNPYLGVGPAILISGIRPDGLGSDSEVNIALVVEAGIRWVALKNVSIDTAYRFRWAEPSYHFNEYAQDTTLRVVDVYSHSFLVRVNYHF